MPTGNATPIVNPNVGEVKPDPDVIRHTHQHTHPGYPDAHAASDTCPGFPDDTHLHTHVPTYQHHDPNQLAGTHDSFIERWNRAEYDRRQQARGRASAGQQQADHDLRQPAGRQPNDPDTRGTVTSIPARVGGNGAMRGIFPDANAKTIGNAGNITPISNIDPLERPSIHTHTFLPGGYGDITHYHAGNTPGHIHDGGYGARIDPGAGEHSNRGADAAHAKQDIRALDDTPDATEDRKRAEAIRQDIRFREALVKARDSLGVPQDADELLRLRELQIRAATLYPKKDGEQEEGSAGS